MEISEKFGKSLVDKSVFLVLWKNWKNSASRLQTPVTMESIGNSQFKGKYGFWNVEFKLFSLQDLFASPFRCGEKELNQHCRLVIRIPVLTQRLKQELKKFGASCLHLALAGPALPVTRVSNRYAEVQVWYSRETDLCTPCRRAPLYTGWVPPARGVSADAA